MAAAAVHTRKAKDGERESLGRPRREPTGAEVGTRASDFHDSGAVLATCGESVVLLGAATAQLGVQKLLLRPLVQMLVWKALGGATSEAR